MEGSCSTGQSPQWAIVPVEEEEEYVYILRIHAIYEIMPKDMVQPDSPQITIQYGACTLHVRYALCMLDN
jgi:hypothetical protein